ncbi:hypothetical protein ETC03_29525, partial [Geobacillus sp. MMMUD3]|nr:hypothetical protein [Geobacillus sp. MMMUD3]
RTALLWIIVAVLAGIVLAFGVSFGLSGNGVAWGVAVLGVVVLGFALWRISRVLSGGRSR